MLMLTLAVTILYIMPIIYIAKVSYSESTFKQTEWDYQMMDYRKKYDATDNQHVIALLRFTDWLLMTLIRSDMGLAGFLIAIVLHSQIYVSLFALQWCAHNVNKIAGQMQTMREIQAGTYSGFELIAPTFGKTNYLSSVNYEL